MKFCGIVYHGLEHKATYMASTLAQKLQLKLGQSLGVINAPAGLLAALALQLPEVTVTEHSPASFDALLLFVNDLTETQTLVPQIAVSMPPTGLFWIAYPKGSSKIKTDVNRDRLWEAVEPMGWRPVRQIALDQVWSALRFHPALPKA